VGREADRDDPGALSGRTRPDPPLLPHGRRRPLFLDPEYAANTRHGGVIAPPTLIDYFAGPGVWPPSSGGRALVREVPAPGDRLVNLANEFEYLAPVRVGDHLSSYIRIADLFIKPTRLDPLSTWIVSETIIENQRGETVAIGRNTLMVHRTPEEVDADTHGTGGSK
jgi:acyl dehydratase